jgi:hypothetical protein
MAYNEVVAAQSKYETNRQLTRRLVTNYTDKYPYRIHTWA